MVSIIMIIIAIALFSAVALAAVNYLPLDAMIQTEARRQIVTGLRSLQEGSIKYIKANTGADGVAILPPAGSDLTSVVTPAFAFLPKANPGLGWEITSGYYWGTMPAIAICLRPGAAVDDAIVRAMHSAVQSLPPGSAFLSGSCGDTSNGGAGSTHLTLWVVAAHHS